MGMLGKGANIVIAPSPSEADLLPLVGDADALLIRSTNLTIPVMEAGKKLKVVGRHGIGLDNIDIPAATHLGIQVVNTPGANSKRRGGACLLGHDALRKELQPGRQGHERGKIHGGRLPAGALFRNWAL